ncbi:N-acetylglucosamine 6-phosphate deacetylase [Oscillatoria nigro-viridis PCC 7112]|uniref:N-acetylglucosamine 6-phosphate deacetylase n=1 Tax=Phormidium nigroviride PCC 7112 TaxID=179408 RepID=K9VKG3_9CYAN|nr:N-acetylglucosamine-6-phosphate deacetylase [Oscillatoria nigro-viridis]AFZ08558.1 N-acetylglucosamine 6-phosphate deacetylase [Oscillatoria nigro-viridis PCC 7112]
MTEATTPTATPTDILNARLPGCKDLQMLAVDETGIIQEVLPMDAVFKRICPPDLQVLDVAGNWLSLGGVDLQINGALGFAFPDLESKHMEILPKICQFLWNQGVDAFLPTLVTTSVDKFRRSLSTIADYIRTVQTAAPATINPKTAEILGVHLEGPFLNPQKRGAHPVEFLLPLTIENVKQVLGDCADIVKIITLAPELDSTGEVISYLQSLGISVSLGHSQATAEQAQQAFARGASMVTHAFNAMPSLHHREPGLLGAAIVYPGVKCGLIADGQHVSPTMIDFLLRAGRYQKGVFLVSDALAPLGLPDGVYPWDSRQIEVRKGTAWVRLDYHSPLESATLAGTTLPLLAGVQNLVEWGICDAESAIALATESPRKAIGISGIIGKSASQLLRWNLNAATKQLTWYRLF